MKQNKYPNKKIIINNFENIKPLLNFDNSDLFYYIQIISRKKDNSNLIKNSEIIKIFYIHSLKDFEFFKDKIIYISKINNARAYINLNRRNNKKIALQMLKKLADMISCNCYNIKNIYSSILGKFNAEPNKVWIIDIDYLQYDKSLGYFRTYFWNNQDHKNLLEELKENYLQKIETLNGLHYLVKPFDLRKFKIKYPTFTIHKDNPTLLFYEK
jgi:hypothetical protein